MICKLPCGWNVLCVCTYKVDISFSGESVNQKLVKVLLIIITGCPCCLIIQCLKHRPSLFIILTVKQSATPSVILAANMVCDTGKLQGNFLALLSVCSCSYKGSSCRIEGYRVDGCTRNCRLKVYIDGEMSPAALYQQKKLSSSRSEVSCISWLKFRYPKEELELA